MTINFAKIPELRPYRWQVALLNNKETLAAVYDTQTKQFVSAETTKAGLS